MLAASAETRAADNPWTATVAAVPWSDTWTGGQTTRDAWSVYSGVTFAPFSPIEDAGWRVRTVAGGGAFRYRKSERTFRAQMGFADLLVGYEWQSGALTAKAFGGLTMLGTVSSPYDRDVAVLDGEIGAKGIVETWLNLGGGTFLQTDLTMSDVGPLLATEIRLGTSIWPGVSAGPEFRANTFARTRDEAGGGGFLRVTWGASELGVSAGLVAAHDRDGWRDAEPYAMVNLTTRR
jgi:hypothetical protein